ncbi:MAG: tRNA (guanosine(37)-N1)-methyltransferase TrmD [Rhodocyclaceae bacterium]|nr:tRNA (guanosine(37)-N1)-methyltransferase TrmD [Rhodocyclaceae bacterium]
MSEAVSRRYDVVTLFPEMFAALTGSGITRRARDRGLYALHYWNPRDFAENVHRTVDDRPYGGGPGMVMMPGPLEAAIESAREAQLTELGVVGKVIYLSPQGSKLDHARVMALKEAPALTLLCGRYEGVDQRVIDRCVDEEISLGDFVLSGGELAAMVVLDAIIRQLPGALNDGDSAVEDSFVTGLLDCPHYTRPETYRGMGVPAELLSGDHARIRRWRLKRALEATQVKRPDLITGRTLTREEVVLLAEIRQDRQ